jgi:hypothetical protein
MKQPDVSKTEPAKGDYLLARAKRELEKLLRQVGASKREALEQVHHQFKPRKESAP